MSDRLSQLSQSGVSIWLDDLSRARLNSGDLARKIREDDVVGVTTNPAIFQAAISGAADYAAPIAELASSGASPEEVIKHLTTDDVREACDLFHDVYERTGGYDGRVSIEVDPRLARRTAETLEQAGELWATVDRPNVMIKIPATVEGLPAITDAIAAGISVNATLIFSVERYVEVAQAYLAGLEKARRAGLDLSGIHSVASFFVSRVDGEVDRLLGELGPLRQFLGPRSPLRRLRAQHARPVLPGRLTVRGAGQGGEIPECRPQADADEEEEQRKGDGGHDRTVSRGCDVNQSLLPVGMRRGGCASAQARKSRSSGARAWPNMTV